MVGMVILNHELHCILNVRFVKDESILLLSPSIRTLKVLHHILILSVRFVEKRDILH